MSMDTNGKIIWAKHSEVQQANLKAMGDTEIKDGERLPLAVKDMGSCEIYPQTIQHNPNGRSVRTGWRHRKSTSCKPPPPVHASNARPRLLQVRGGLRRRRVHHLHGHGSEEQELRLRPGVRLGSRFFRVSVAASRDRRRPFESGQVIKTLRSVGA